MPLLPPGARDFLTSPEGRPAAAIARSFHRWLARDDIQCHLGNIMPDGVWRFVSVLGRPPREHFASATEASQRWYQLFPYLQWLWRGDWLRFDPEVLRSAPPPPSPNTDPYSGSPSDPHFLWCHQDWRPFLRRRHPLFRRRYRPRARLPEIAQRFLGTLTTTRKPQTVAGYACGLGRFCAFLEKRKLSLTSLSRRHVEDWCQALHAEGLHPSTRLDLLTQTRTYLRWAQDEGLVTADPDLLIRRSDFPKLPQYLPRPLPPDVDRELQARLATGGQDQLALLLMRRTGLRIGELIGLEHQCLRTDPKGRLYLKVPLGKLDTERIVPLDDDTIALVRHLQEGGARALLLVDGRGHQTPYEAYRRALIHASSGLVVAEPITSHRLRHTYATALLAGGMSLPALMRILGHRDHRMTLRYAAITDDLMAKEYSEALTKLGERYRLHRGHPVSATNPDDADPLTVLADVARWITNRTPAGRDRNALVKRIRRLIEDLRGLDPPGKR